MKKIVTKVMAVVAVMVIGMAGIAMAANNPDSMEVSVTPVTTYSIQIATPAAGLEFTGSALDTAYVHEVSATVKNNGTVRADWTMKATALNTWTLGTASLTDTGLDKMVLAAQLNSTPAGSGTYVDADVLTGSEKDANATNFNGDQSGDNVTVNAEKLLWIYVKTPNDTTVDTAQKFRVDIKAYPANRF